MRLTKPRRPGLWLLKLLPALLLLAPLLSLALRAQEESNAKAIVAAAVDTELNADRTDHTAFQYLDHDVTPDHDTVFLVVETPQGSLKRKIEDHGRPLSPGQRQADDQRLQNFLSNRGLQQKEKRDSAHDDAQAEALLKLLPVAFLWTMRGETPSAITLAYKPDPSFHPPTMEAKVLGAMTGEIVVARPSNRIEDIRGKLMNDVKIAFGPMVLARLRLAARSTWSGARSVWATGRSPSRTFISMARRCCSRTSESRKTRPRPASSRRPL